MNPVHPAWSESMLCVSVLGKFQNCSTGSASSGCWERAQTHTLPTRVERAMTSSPAPTPSLHGVTFAETSSGAYTNRVCAASVSSSKPRHKSLYISVCPPMQLAVCVHSHGLVICVICGHVCLMQSYV